MITGTTQLYAIIGDPIAHVRTPMAFNDYFAARKIDAVCLPIHIRPRWPAARLGRTKVDRQP